VNTAGFQSRPPLCQRTDIIQKSFDLPFYFADQFQMGMGNDLTKQSMFSRIDLKFTQTHIYLFVSVDIGYLIVHGHLLFLHLTLQEFNNILKCHFCFIHIFLIFTIYHYNGMMPKLLILGLFLFFH